MKFHGCPSDRAISTKVKKEVIEACLGKSKREVEKTLLEKQSEAARALTQENFWVVSETRSEIKFTITKTTLENLQQLKDLVGNPSLEKIFNDGLEALLIAEKKRRGMTKRKSVNARAARCQPADRNVSKKIRKSQSITQPLAQPKQMIGKVNGRPADLEILKTRYSGNE